MSVAIGKRKILKIKLRQFQYLLLQGWKKILKNIKNPRQGQKLTIYPPVEDRTILGDILNRVSWYLPSFKSIGISPPRIPVQEGIGDVSIKDIPVPKFQENYLNEHESFQFVSIEKNITFEKDELVLLYKKQYLKEHKILNHIDLVEIVDPTFYSTTSCGNFRKLFFELMDTTEKKNLLKLYKSNFKNLKQETDGYEKSYVFGLGPSLTRAWDYNFRDGFSIVCNSMVKNQELLQHINPTLLVFADPVFHFGPSKYAATFRNDVLETVERFNCWVAVPHHSAPLLLYHYPQLKKYIIGIPNISPKINFPDLDTFSLMPTGNILTAYMLPIASSFTKNIGIIGCDGRKESSKYFWKHESSAQYTGLMKTVFKTHPSFFRDRIYTDYYAQHCRLLERMLRYGEEQGKKYRSLTNSYIPALKMRH